MKTIIVGDTHGLIEETTELVEKKAGWTAGRDVLMSVGDMVDKGPESAAVVEFFRSRSARVTKGNHEEKHIKRIGNLLKAAADPKYKLQGKWDEGYEAVLSSLSQSQKDWICTLPSTITFGEDNSWILVHAGLDYGVPLEKQGKCLWLRYIDKTTGKMIPFDGTPGVPENGVWWAERWKGPEKVVYGHQPWNGEVRVENGTYGIDTGAVHGRKLTALVFEGTITKDAIPEIVQVQAKKIYSPDIYVD
jgi:diadenosine tetraphosphatase ApaH/serine/threonine PP2A family protein phosphatase